MRYEIAVWPAFIEWLQRVADLFARGNNGRG